MTERVVGGTRELAVGGVVITAMVPEYREALDEAMARWAVEHAALLRDFPVVHEADGRLNLSSHVCSESDVYSFAYWLLRYSGLVAPTPAAARRGVREVEP